LGCLQAERPGIAPKTRLWRCIWAQRIDPATPPGSKDKRAKIFAQWSPRQTTQYTLLPKSAFMYPSHSFDLNRFVFVQHSIAKSLPHLLRPTLIEPGMFLPWNNRDIMRNVHSLFNHSGSLLMEWLWVSMRLIHNDTMDNSISASKPDNLLSIFSSISTGHSHFYVNVSSTT